METPDGKEKEHHDRISACMCSHKWVVSVVWRPGGVFVILAFQCWPVKEGQSWVRLGLLGDAIFDRGAMDSEA